MFLYITRYLYWIQTGKNPAVLRYNENGGRSNVIVTDSLTKPTALAIDENNEKLYIADQKPVDVISCEINGN